MTIMDGVGNRYGVHTVILEVDGEEVFRSVVDRFAYEENRYINSWTHGQYMKSFIEPGNRLRMLHASNGNRGLVEINEERPYRFVYTLSDALGNTSKSVSPYKGRTPKFTLWNIARSMLSSGTGPTICRNPAWNWLYRVECCTMTFGWIIPYVR